jgi:hypothetical protein
MVNRLKVIRAANKAAKTMRDRTGEIKKVTVIFDNSTYVSYPVTQALQIQMGDEHFLTLTVKIGEGNELIPSI